MTSRCENGWPCRCQDCIDADPPAQEAASKRERFLWWLATRAEIAAFRMKERRHGNR